MARRFKNRTPRASTLYRPSKALMPCTSAEKELRLHIACIFWQGPHEFKNVPKGHNLVQADQTVSYRKPTHVEGKRYSMEDNTILISLNPIESQSPQ
jgi:hypothetical protein